MPGAVPLDRYSGGSRRWSLTAAGSFAIHDSIRDQDVTPRSRKARAILAYLGSRPGAHVSREKIAELLWGDREEPQAKASLRQALLEIRKAAPGQPPLICSDRGHLWIDDTTVDVIFDTSSNGGGDFVPFEDLDHISAEFDHWLEIERSRRSREAAADLRREAELRLEAGHAELAIEPIEAAWRIDPYDEDALRLALQAEYQAGHAGAIEQRFQAMVELLKNDLGVEPAAETRELHDRLVGELRNHKEPTPDTTDEAGQAAAQGPRPKSRRKLWILIALVALILVVATAWTVVRSPASAETRRIAVLPFRAMGGVEPLLAEGVADEILTELSRQQEIQTVGRTSSWVFKDKPDDLRRVGRKLDADYVVEGTLRQSNGTIRATVALIDTRDAGTLWSQSFESPSGNVQRLERAAASAILRQLGIARPTAVTSTDPQAFANYVRAKALIRDRNFPKMREARDLLRTAVEIDPGFAPAWAQLGGAINFVRDGNRPEPGDDPMSWRRAAVAAANRSIKLDPGLAEGHAMLAFIYGFDSDVGRRHLMHAAKLDSRNPQTLYWQASAAGIAGHYDRQGALLARALQVDPLWRRPIEVAAVRAIIQGRAAEADQMLARLRAADPDAAVEVEMAMLRAKGDLSKVIEIGRREYGITNATAAKVSLSWSLIELGFVREGLLLGNADAFERLTRTRRLPARPGLMEELKTVAGSNELMWELVPTIVELSRARRFADIVALYDRPESGLKRLGEVRDSTREARLTLAAMVAEALAKNGRGPESRNLMNAADEAQRVVLQNRFVDPQVHLSAAIYHAIAGRESLAIEQIDRAVGKGWYAFEGTDYRLNDVPWFAALRDDPRFERLNRTVDARLSKERRETEALGLI